MDKIIIKELELFARHGVNPEEKRDGQTFVLDVTLHLDLSRPCRTDSVEDTVSYAKAAKTIRRVIQENCFDLLERAAQEVCDALLAEYPLVQAVDVLLKKPQAPVKLQFAYMAVELHRERGAL